MWFHLQYTANVCGLWRECSKKGRTFFLFSIYDTLQTWTKSIRTCFSILSLFDCTVWFIAEDACFVSACMSAQPASVTLDGHFLFLFSFSVCFSFVCFASPCVSIWLVCIQQKIRHSFIHSVALDCHSVRDALKLPSPTAALCCFKKNLFKHFVICFVLNNLLQPLVSSLPSCTFSIYTFSLFSYIHICIYIHIYIHA